MTSDMEKAPNEYNPQWCDLHHVNTENKFKNIIGDVKEVGQKVNRIDRRIFSLILMAFVQVLTALGGAGFLIFDHILKTPIPKG